MELLNLKHYDKVINHLKQVKINNLFARSVIEKKVRGKVFVDNDKDPKTFYIVHPYGISLLFGDSQNIDFNKKFLEYSLNLNHKRNEHEWMQAYPENWHAVLSEIYKDKLIKSCENNEKIDKGVIELNTRVNFSFHREKYLANSEISLPEGSEIIPADSEVFNKMSGSVIPLIFWDNEIDFVKNGIGFSLFCDNKLASTAYSAFIHDDKLEIGIETFPEFRRKGFAFLVCSTLIDYCLDIDYEPVWSCKLENSSSYRLALKLGFEPSLKFPFYRLSN